MGQLFYTQLGCYACHSLDGTPMVGPTWAGLYGREVELTTGERVVADEAYLRESIEDPDAKIVRGYAAGVMTATIAPRSEEHTSELQSRENLVCRLLLEKKKTG